MKNAFYQGNKNIYNSFNNKSMDNKTMSQSLTLQALAVSVILYFCQSFGLDLDKGIITEMVLTIATLISLSVAVYGRIRANTRLIK